MSAAYERYRLQFKARDGMYSDLFDVVARSQEEAEAYAMGTIAPAREYHAAIVGVWCADSVPIYLAVAAGGDATGAREGREERGGA